MLMIMKFRPVHIVAGENKGTFGARGIKLRASIEWNN